MLERPAEQHGAQHPHALVAARQRVELVEKRVEEHAEGEREHAEVDLHVAHAQEPHRNGDERGRHRRRQQHDLQMPHTEPAREQRCRVAAQRDEERVAEREQARRAEQQIQAEERDRVAEGGQEQGGRVGPARERQQQQRRAGGAAERTDAHAMARAKSPAGRRTSTAMTIT